MLVSLLEALIVIGPLLGSIAYVTIAERKIMGSMQRRIGPNKVGQPNLIRYYHHSSIMHNNNNNNNNNNNSSYHNESSLENDAIIDLYKDRVTPIKIFDSNRIISTCYNLLDLEKRLTFLNEWKNRSGIYLIQYKFDRNIYYIGKTINFSTRLRSHIKHKLTDRFHLFANLVGWEKFEFSIIEECSLNNLGERENWYLQEYLPLLNSNFVSNHSDLIIFNSLYDKLKMKQSNLNLLDNKYKGIPIYLYKFTEFGIDNNYQYYNGINNLSDTLNISRATIRTYLDTNVPYKGYLFYSRINEDLELSYNLAKNSTLELNLNNNIAKEVWVYSITLDGNIKGYEKFDSREKVAKYLDVSTKLIRYHIDNWKSKGINGYYLFSKQLDQKELQNLLELSRLEIKNSKVGVWIYYAKTVELIDSFESMQKAANYLNIDYRTILKHLDTNIATKQNGKLVLLFSSELTIKDKERLLKNLNKAKNAITEVWVYKMIDNKYILINNNEPTFASKLKASKELGISDKTITRFLDTNISYKDYLFYSEKQVNF